MMFHGIYKCTLSPCYSHRNEYVELFPEYYGDRLVLFNAQNDRPASNSTFCIYYYIIG